MSTIQKLKNNNISMSIMIFSAICVSSMAGELTPVEKTSLCSSMGYVKPKHFPILIEKPSQTSSKIACLHERQYLCIVDYDPIDKWAYVTVASDAICNKYPQDTNCQGYKKTPERSYPVEWLSRTNNNATECRIELLPEGTDYYPNWKYVGDCVSGWMQKEDLIIINN